jgi:hypothetical protein
MPYHHGIRTMCRYFRRHIPEGRHPMLPKARHQRHDIPLACVGCVGWNACIFAYVWACLFGIYCLSIQHPMRGVAYTALLTRDDLYMIFIKQIVCWIVLLYYVHGKLHTTIKVFSQQEFVDHNTANCCISSCILHWWSTFANNNSENHCIFSSM